MTEFSFLDELSLLVLRFVIAIACKKYSEHNEAYSDIGQAFAYLIKAGNSNLVYLSEHLVSRSLWSQMAPSA